MKVNDFDHVLVMLTSENNSPDNHCEEAILGCDEEKNLMRVQGTKPLLSSPQPVTELIYPSKVVK